VADLFDTPFEEDDDTPEASAEPTPSRAGAGRDGSREGGAPQRHIFTVSELTAGIRSLIEREFGEVWVEGEISNCRVWNTTGHMYFTLKDDAAQLKAVMFRTSLRYLRFKPEDGLRVVARGRLGVYEPKGEYQIVCEHMEPQGLGALQLAFEQLKKRLHAEGLFDAARKRPLPALPRRIGVVTSLDGAAIRDILKVLRRRAPNASVLICPARVQGEDASAELRRALRLIARVDDVDVVIVGRGGGSAEDLWAFNDERLARAIAAHPVPVVSAVGHEVDFTIADFVADLRAPTPSAGAEMVVAAKEEFCARIDRLSARLRAVFQARLATRDRRAAELAYELRAAARGLVGAHVRRFRGLEQRLEQRDLRRRFANSRARLTRADARLGGAARARWHRADARFRGLAGRLENLSPLGVLARGYAVCWNADKTTIIRSADAVVRGDAVRVTLAKGEVGCRVEDVEK
jgi:exodeoxyribonuclease VII large subunit